MAKNTETVETKIETPVDPWAEKVPVFLYKNDGDSEPLYVKLNGRRFLVPRGKTTYVPRPIFDIIQQSLDAHEYTERIDAQNEFTERQR